MIQQQERKRIDMGRNIAGKGILDEEIRTMSMGGKDLSARNQRRILKKMLKDGKLTPDEIPLAIKVLDGRAKGTK